MSIDVEELLTDELQRRADGVGWQAGLLHGALRRHRRRQVRRRVVLPALAAGLAAAAAVPVAVTAVGQQAPAATSRVQTVAYVLSHARSAVAAAGDDVLQARSRVGDKFSLTTWIDQATGKFRVQISSPGTKPRDIYGSMNSPQVTVVSYQGSTWATLSPMGATGSQAPGVPPLLGPVSWSWGGLTASLPTPAGIRKDLADGIFHMVGAQTENGRRELHLQGSVRTPGGFSQMVDLRTVDLWVDAATYLPVQSVVAAQSPVKPLSTTQFSWLQATSANVAVLTPQIPAGFTELSH